MEAARITKESIVPILRNLFRVWDHRVREGCDNHGAESLIIQDAHRIAQTLALLHDWKAPGRLLEIGTGYLGLVVALRRLFPRAKITGLEYPGRRYIWTQDYRTRLTAERIHLVATDVVGSGIPFHCKTFDVVIFAEVVEHLPPNALPAVLTEVARSMVAGGLLLITTPNLASWTNRELLLRGDSPGQQSPALIIDGAYGHLRLYTMEELVQLVEKAGFHVIRRTFIDQIQLGLSRSRSLIRLALRPVKSLWPALRDTSVILAVRDEG